MVKKTSIALFSLICCILLLGCHRANAALGDDFIGDVRLHARAAAKSGAGELQKTHSASLHVILSYKSPGKGDMRYTSVFRSKKTVVVLGVHDDGDLNNQNPQDVAFFKTKDPSLVFAGTISVGGSLKKAFQSKKLGTPDEENPISEGESKGQTRYIWYWEDAQGTATSMTVGMTAKGDVIQEIDFFDEMISVGVDAVGKSWEKAEYLGVKPAAVSPVQSFQAGISDMMWSLVLGTNRLTPYSLNEEQRIHRSKNIIILEVTTWDGGGDGTYNIYLQTRDPALVFPGKIKVGGSLKGAVSSGKIPGTRQKVKKTSSGLYAHMWSTKWYDFTLRCKGDTIQEIVYFDRSENAKIDWKRVQYLK